MQNLCIRKRFNLGFENMLARDSQQHVRTLESQESDGGVQGQPQLRMPVRPCRGGLRLIDQELGQRGRGPPVEQRPGILRSCERGARLNRCWAPAGRGRCPSTADIRALFRGPLAILLRQAEVGATRHHSRQQLLIVL